MGTLGKTWRVKSRWDEMNDGSIQWRKTDRHRGYANRARIRCLIRYGGCCAECGMKDARVLQFDHINGDGRKEAREKGGWTAHYNRILKAPWGRYQILCANCNWIKRTVNGELNQHSPKHFQVETF